MSGPSSLLFHGIVGASSLQVKTLFTRRPELNGVIVALEPCSVNDANITLGGNGTIFVWSDLDLMILDASEEFRKSWKPVLLTTSSISRNVSIHTLIGGRQHDSSGSYHLQCPSAGSTSPWNHKKDISVGDVTYRVLFDRIGPVPSSKSAQTKAECR
jgi:hypothetical protein